MDEGLELAVASLDAVSLVVTPAVVKCFELRIRGRGTTAGDIGATAEWDVVVVEVWALTRKREVINFPGVIEP